MNIHIIGGGNLGVAIALGISDYTTGNNVTVTRRNTESIAYLATKGIQVHSQNTHQIEAADLIILTVKPYQVDAVLEEIVPHLTHQVIASAVSGLAIESLLEKPKKGANCAYNA